MFWETNWNMALTFSMSLFFPFTSSATHCFMAGVTASSLGRQSFQYQRETSSQEDAVLTRRRWAQVSSGGIPGSRIT